MYSLRIADYYIESALYHFCKSYCFTASVKFGGGIIMSAIYIISWIIMVFVGIVTVKCIFDEEDIKKQLNACLVLIPIVLRALLLK